jgi:hypothetical protein
MPYSANFDWFEPNLLIDLPRSNVRLVMDSPFMTRPPGVTHFIGIQLEPNMISGARDAFIRNHKNFDIIVTYDEEILKACPNAKFYVYGTSWIPKHVYENIDISRKKLRISSLTGWKAITEGHKFRMNLYEQQRNIPLPIDWYRSGHTPSVIPVGIPMFLPEITNNPIIESANQTGKVQLFLEYQFALVIENCKQTNWFSEKLIDCLVTKTIPIYYGCPNISKWFDTTGWIILTSDSIPEFIEKCRNLPDYETHTDVINKNYEAAKKFVNFTKNVGDAIGLSVKSSN